MISIVTAYYNRKKLLVRTLESMRQYVGNIDFEFIVVDDGSSEIERLEDLVSIYPFLRLHRIERTAKWYSNPCIPFNIGFEIAKGDKIILQNPENYHFKNILSYVDKNLNKNLYLSFGCYSLDLANTESNELFYDRDNINNLILNNNFVFKGDGELGWYNHSVFRPKSYHFCTAIMANDLVDLGGFDPRFAMGYGYDDDDLIYRIKLKGMKIRFVDDLYVIHQNHYSNKSHGDRIPDKYKTEASLRNKILFETVTKKSRNYRANVLAINSFRQKEPKNYVYNLRLKLYTLKVKILRYLK